MSYTVQKWDNNTAEIAYKLYAFDTDFIIEKEVLTGTSTESTYYNSNVSRETITDAWAARASKSYDYTLKDKLVDNRFNRNFLAFEDAYACNLDDSARKGININVADFPYLWIFGNGGTGYYPTYTGDTFLIAGSGCIFGGGESDYDTVTNITLSLNNLTTDFTPAFFEKFPNLSELFLNNNLITNLEFPDSVNLESLALLNNKLTSFSNANINNLTLRLLNLGGNLLGTVNVLPYANLEELYIQSNPFAGTTINLSSQTKLKIFRCFQANITTITGLYQNTELEDFRANGNDISVMSFATFPLLTYITLHFNEVSNLINSQLLIDLDAHGLPNGYFQSSIFGGGTLTTAGTTAKNNLLTKGWTIVGL